jgi:hypothetical protein
MGRAAGQGMRSKTGLEPAGGAAKTRRNEVAPRRHEQVLIKRRLFAEEQK